MVLAAHTAVVMASIFSAIFICLPLLLAIHRGLTAPRSTAVLLFCFWSEPLRNNTEAGNSRREDWVESQFDGGLR